MDIWSRLKKDPEGADHSEGAASWMDDGGSPAENREEGGATTGNAYPELTNQPLEPESKGSRLPLFIKWSFFMLIIVYAVISYYRIPLLNHLGQYLVIQHSLKNADMMICMAGPPVERGMAAAEIYKTGLAPRIFISRSPAPDAMDMLKRRGVVYPEIGELLLNVLSGLGVPQDVCRMSSEAAETMIEEVNAVKAVCMEEGYRTLIVVTSPIQSRRTWLAYRSLMGDEWDIMVMPTPYSGFRPTSWWKEEKYVGQIVIEYQKLIFQFLRSL